MGGPPCIFKFERFLLRILSQVLRRQDSIERRVEFTRIEHLFALLDADFEHLGD